MTVTVFSAPLLRSACTVSSMSTHLWRTALVGLNVGPAALPDLLDLGPALPDDAPHDALVDEHPDLLGASVVLLLLVHEGDGGLHHLAARLEVLARHRHDPFGTGGVRDPGEGISQDQDVS